MDVQTGRSQLRRYKSKKSLVPEGEAASEQAKPKSQILEFWLVREYCDKGSLMVRSTPRSPPPPPPPRPVLAPFDHHCRVAQLFLLPLFLTFQFVTGAHDDSQCHLFALSAGACFCADLI